mgnify:CR=1 FL=1
MTKRQDKASKIRQRKKRWLERMNYTKQTDAKDGHYIINQKGKEVDVLIYGVIGGGFFGEGISAADFATDLKNTKSAKRINVRINSEGGLISDGKAIYNALVHHPAEVDVLIEGIALSSASFIAMAGDTIRMAENADFMIHDPRVFMAGTAEDLRKEAEVLDTQRDQIANTYAKRTDIALDDLKEWMADETWFTAESALDAGFIDEIVEGKTRSNFKSMGFVNIPNRSLPFAAAERYLPDEEEPKGGDPMALNESLKAKFVAAGMPSDISDDEAQNWVVENFFKAEEPTPEEEPEVEVDEPVNVDDDAVRVSEKTRQKQITALCEMANVDDKHRKSFIDNDFTLEGTQDAITNILKQQRRAVPDDGGADPEPVNENQKYVDEYKENQAYYTNSGTTEDEYIRTRRIDDGLDELVALNR